MDKYEIMLYWSKRDMLYIAEVPELSGCSAHGNSREETLRNVNEAIRLWVETAIEFGNPVPEPKGRNLNYS